MFKKVVLTQVTTTIIHTKKKPILKTAMFGGELVVNTLDDPSIKDNTSGTQSGTKLRIPRKWITPKKYAQWRFIN